MAPPGPTGARPPGPAGASDEALLAAVGAGDPAAFTVFFDRHAPRVHGLARIILGDPVAADDAVQETFLRVWRFASGFDPRRGSVAGWLMSAARNVSVDAARLRGTLQYLDPEILLSLAAAAPGAGPAEAALAASEADRVRTALMALPLEQRRVLLLARWWGLSAAEIAARDHLPVGTVKSRMRLGLARVRTLLDDADPVSP